MIILDPTSLQNTVDNLNEALLFGDDIPPSEKQAAASWIAGRQGLPRAYLTMFAPTDLDFKRGIHTFTGEALESASARHILGQEAARALCLLGSSDPEDRAAYDRASEWMRDEGEFYRTGRFCCGRCTPAFWRHYWVGDFEDKPVHMLKALAFLKSQRLGDGKWARFPFYYTIYTLQEIELEPALDELCYARQAMETALERLRSGPYHARRQAVLEKALAL